MSSSILTNASAMSALTSLRFIQNSLLKTQDVIATGQRINESKDNTAYWSVASNMRTDTGLSSVVRDALALGKSTVDQSYLSVRTIEKISDELKQLAASASGMTTVDQNKVWAAIKDKLSDIDSAISSAGLNGKNYIDGSLTAKEKILSGFTRSETGTTFQYIEFDAPNTNLKNSYTTLNAAILEIVDAETLPDDAVSKLTKAIETFTTDVSKADSSLGTIKNRIDSKIEFAKQLADNLEKSIGALLDADMNAESAKISALKIQQDLAIEVLSIANQSSQGILELYRQP